MVCKGYAKMRDQPIEAIQTGSLDRIINDGNTAIEGELDMDTFKTSLKTPIGFLHIIGDDVPFVKYVLPVQKSKTATPKCPRM